MRYNTFGYHCSGDIIKPRKTDGNIKGIELEISDYDSGDILDDMIERGLLTVPDNQRQEKEFNIAVENDGSVFKELIIKACCNQTLFKHFKMLDEELNGNIDNRAGTSCHVHINNRYLRKEGITKESIVKATEFLAPLLYSISERDSGAYYDWCHSRIDFDTSEPTLFDRADDVDYIDIYDYDDRYNIVNPKRETTEIRIFSNKCGFEYKKLKLYIEVIDFIIELAKEMQGKLYEEQFDNIIEKIKEFFNAKSRKEFIQIYSLEPFFLKEGEYERAKLISRIARITTRFASIKQEFTEFKNTYEVYIKILRIFRDNRRFLRNIESIQLNTIDIEYINELENIVIENIKEEVNNL